MASADARCYYLVGSTGFPNYGDELIAATWLRHLARVAPDADVWLDCTEPSNARLLLDGLHPRVRFVDTLWRLCRDAPSDDPWEVAAWVERAVHDPGLAARWVAGIELLARADVVHLIGGGYVTALWPRRIGLLAGAVAAARRSGGRAVMTGQGFHPAARDTVPLLRALVERFDLVDVRDERSAELAGAAAEMTCDDVFLRLAAGAADLVDHAGPVPEYMVCAQADAGELSRQRLAGTVLDTLRAWGAAPDRVGFVEGIPALDREVFALVEHELPGVRFYPFHELWRDGLPIAPHQRWLSTRFHLHLLAAAAGASGVALSVHPEYYTAKHRSLIDLGSGWRLLDPATARDEIEAPAGGGFPAQVLRRCAARKADVASALYPPSSVPATPPFDSAGLPLGAGPGAARRPHELWARLVRGV
ncbi:MAG: polysaccharide pyruvyl transferase family protein [Pseudonocardia sp.]|nr:polysaccharide pyruvyl transferase family protein [Pseudonocardia sp.]